MKNYLIYGTDKQINHIQTNKIVKSCLSEVNEFNFMSFDCTETPLYEIIEAIESFSFFSQQRVIVLKEALFLSTSTQQIPFDNDYDTLLACLSNIDEQTVVVIIVPHEKLDTRKNLVKKIQALLEVIKTDEYSQDQLRTLISRKLESEGFSIEGEATALFLKRSPNDVASIRNNLDKVMLYESTSKHITYETVTKMLIVNIEDNIFDLSTAFLRKDTKKMYHCLNEMKQLKEEPIKLIVMISNQIRLILQVQALATLRHNQAEIASILKVHPYRIKLIFSEYLYHRDLKSYQKQLYELNRSIITGKTKGYLGLELFLIRNTI